MATKQVRQPRPPRQAGNKAVAPEVVSAAQPVVNEAPKPTESPAPVVAMVTEAPQPVVTNPVPTEVSQPSTPEQTSNNVNRTHAGRSIGINIPSARVRRHMDKLNINSLIDEEIKGLKVKINLFKAATSLLETKTTTVASHSEVNEKKKQVNETRPATEDELAKATQTVSELTPLMTELEQKFAALTRSRTRFSDEAPVALSVVCEEMISSLTRHGMDRVLKNKKKIIQLTHLHEEGICSLPLYALYRDLPSFVRNSKSIAQANQEAAAKLHDASLLAQAERDFKKIHSIKAKAKGKNLAAETILATPPSEQPAAPEPEAAAPETEEVDAQDSKTTFKHYIQQIFKSLQELNPEYKDLRMSHGVKEYLSDLVIEFIRKLSGPLVLIATSMKNKTVSDIVVMRAIHLFMTDGHTPVKTVTFKEEQVRDPSFIRAEAGKQEEAKKNGATYSKPLVKDIPLVTALVAEQVTRYPTSGFDELNAKVQEKLRLYESLSEEAKKALNEAKELVAQ